MDRDEAFKLVKEKVRTENLVKHMIAVEAIMRRLAKELGEDEELWGLTGLLHDIDFEETKRDPKKHGILGADFLEGKVPPEVVRAIRRHNFENNGEKPPETKMEIGLIAADALSGLIVAAALVMPHKKVEEVKVSTLINKFKDKSFARRVSREKIKYCEKLGVPLERFLELGLEAVRSVASELGL